MADEHVRGRGSLVLQEWDVLGVAQADVSPESEYLHEAREILARLSQGASESELADYLSKRAAELAHGNRGRDRRPAAAVVEWWPDSVERSRADSAARGQDWRIQSALRSATIVVTEEGAMVTWPVPLPDVEPEPEPGGWHAPEAPPALEVTGDGARWLAADGETRQVAPPGTDHHRVRFVHRGLPATDYALQWLRQIREDPATAPTEREAVEGLLGATDGDDVALLMAAAFIGRIGLEAALDGERQRAEALQAALEVVESAVRRAQDATTPDTGLDDFRQAGARWRDQQDT